MNLLGLLLMKVGGTGLFEYISLIFWAANYLEGICFESLFDPLSNELFNACLSAMILVKLYRVRFRSTYFVGLTIASPPV